MTRRAQLQIADVGLYREARVLASDLSDFLLLAAHQNDPEMALHFLRLAQGNHERVNAILAAIEQKMSGAAVQ